MFFPAEWKKADLVPAYKKGDHQCVKIYSLVSLLPVFSKIFERLIYNAVFKHFLGNNFISSNQSGFKPDAFCINQLIAVTHEVFYRFWWWVRNKRRFSWYINISIYLKLSTKYGMRDLFINYVVMVFVEIYCNYW